MDTSYEFPHDDYALTMLTHAAMHTTQTDLSTSTTYATQPALRSRSITNHSNHQVADADIDITERSSSQARIPHILGDYNPSLLSNHNMETLTFNPSAAGRSTMPYMNQAYQGIGSQISQNYANSLGILNAESYDDVRGAMRAQEASDARLKRNRPTMPFGITSGPKISLESEPRAGSEELDAGPRRKKKPRVEVHSGDDEEDAKKKARGRPRVDTRDETAADRRRTQIRMAQRAYRHRKETTISSLEKRVQELKGTNEEMSNIFISLYDFAVGKGILDREPEFGRQLQSTTERFLALAKTAEDHDDNHVEEAEKHEEEAESTAVKPKGRRASPKKRQQATPPVSEPTNLWGGYTLSKEDSQIEEIDLGYQPDQQYRTRDDLQIITRPTEDNASFPFDFMDLQQYRVEVPEIDSFSVDFFSNPQLPLPSTYSHDEFSFARRIHRGGLERALRYIRTAEPSDKLYQHVFGFSGMYQSKDAIEARLKRLLSASTKETLQEWRAPFVHVGGSGTHYPMADIDMNNELAPKFQTGFSMGPFSPSAAQLQDTFDDDLMCNMPGFEGEFFDPNDVEGYLRGRGLDIPPAAEYVSGEIDLDAITEMSSPKSYGSDTATDLPSPQTPRSLDERFLLDQDEFDFGKRDTVASKSLTYPQSYDIWEKNSSRNENLIDPIFSTIPDQTPIRVKTPEVKAKRLQSGEKRTVTINVTTLLDELLRRGICLGRSPGFKPADVNAAIIAAIKAGF